MNWLDTPNIGIYQPALNEAEVIYGIPHNLLARVACQESHFIPNIVDCVECSRAGCLGLMQLNPRFFPNAGKDWHADVVTAAIELRRLYLYFQTWQLALMSYNWGQGNVEKWLANPKTPVPQETQDYVTAITADVPVQ